MFNIIFPIIIFVSLAVIVFIIGKHLPEFVDIKNSDQNIKALKNKKDYLKKILFLLKDCLLWLVEKIITKFSQFLNLIHSWIVNVKKNKKKDEFQENKENKTEKEVDKIDKEKFFQDKKEDDNFEKEDRELKESKITKAKNFLFELKDSLKNKILEKKRKKINQVFQEMEEEEFDSSQFSDGIVGVHEKEINSTKSSKEKLINEVVEVKKSKKDEMSLDDEIGVDRNILEKKLIGKIVENPKEKELYRQLGELYLKMQNYSDAEGCYKQILKISIRDIDARRKIERIRLLKRSSR